MTDDVDVIVCGVYRHDRRINRFKNTEGSCDDCGRTIIVPFDALSVPRKVCTACAMKIDPAVERVIRSIAKTWNMKQ